MFCRQCGKEIDNDSAFCEHCGAVVKKLKNMETVVSETKPSIDNNRSMNYSKKNSEQGRKKFLLPGIFAILILVTVLSTAGLYSLEQKRIEQQELAEQRRIEQDRILRERLEKEASDREINIVDAERSFQAFFKNIDLEKEFQKTKYINTFVSKEQFVDAARYSNYLPIGYIWSPYFISEIEMADRYRPWLESATINMSNRIKVGNDEDEKYLFNCVMVIADPMEAIEGAEYGFLDMATSYFGDYEANGYHDGDILHRSIMQVFDEKIVGQYNEKSLVFTINAENVGGVLQFDQNSMTFSDINYNTLPSNEDMERRTFDMRQKLLHRLDSINMTDSELKLILDRIDRKVSNATLDVMYDGTMLPR